MRESDKNRLINVAVGFGLCSAVGIFFYIFIVLWTN